MNKLNQRILLTALFAVTVNLAAAQSITDDYLTHKVIVNHTDHTVVTYVKPVKQLDIQSDKLYHWFSPGQISSTTGGYSGKLLNGDFQDFYTNKQLKESGIFNAGLKVGKWSSWTETGNLREEYTWGSGKRSGRYSKYNATGKLVETGKYRNDLLHGKQQSFMGDSTKVVLYKRGKVYERKKIQLPKFMQQLFSKKQTTK